MKLTDRHFIALFIRVILPVAVLGCSVSAAAEPLPAAEQIMDRHVAATGGRAAYDRIRNRVTRGTIEFVGQGITLDMHVAAAKPNLTRIALESAALGRIEKGTVRDLVWEVSTMGGPQVKEGKDRATALRDAAFDRLVYWRSAFARVETVGRETVDGRACYRVVAHPREGPSCTFWYDVASGLMLRFDSVAQMEMGNVPVSARMGDYRRVDKILYPCRVQLEVVGQKRLVTVRSIRHNVNLPPDAFEAPESVRRLAAAEATPRG